MDMEQTTKILVALGEIKTQQINMADDIKDLKNTQKEVFTEIKAVDTKYSNRIVGALGVAFIGLVGALWGFINGNP